MNSKLYNALLEFARAVSYSKESLNRNFFQNNMRHIFSNKYWMQYATATKWECVIET
jgi:hypothetical protein